MGAYTVWVVVALVMLEVHGGPEVLEEVEGFEGVEDLEEMEDLGLLVQWVGPEDLCHQPLFFYYEYTSSCLKFVQYVL